MSTLSNASAKIFLSAAALFIFAARASGATGCPPTEPDEVGPFYRPNAPVRSQIGDGYLLAGTVLSSPDCTPIPQARIEVWQAGPAGRYDDAHRATLFSDEKGRYRLETHFPPAYRTRPPHIHILVEAPGFQRLITQHYPKKGAKQATFALVLVPAR
ncbi:MAG: intradiol ring-cleavage [Geobacteraceae bacterium]|nr:MAG: intradiol ring-cleavage [Geobacteraceae bacterium]